MKKITVKDLHKPHKAGVCLHCQLCGSDFSADPGDYGRWNGFGDDHVFKHCGRPMRLAIKKTIYVEVQP